MDKKKFKDLVELNSKFTKQGSNDGQNTKDSIINVRHQEQEKHEEKE